MLHWLPDDPNWRARLKALATARAAPTQAWAEAIALARLRCDFVRAGALDQTVRALFDAKPPAGLTTKPIRLAILSSCTTTHLHAALRVAGLRRGLWIDIYENDFGQYRQELWDEKSALHAFAPTHVLLALDSRHLSAGASVALEPEQAETLLQTRLADLDACWSQIRRAFKAQIIQQTALPVAPTLLGSNAHRAPGAAVNILARLNQALREKADAHGVDLLALDSRIARDGLDAWHDDRMWRHAKQEVALKAAPFYGDLAARLLAARQGRSGKCLVLDLDNTLWGGVIGDDGLDGVVLGQGDALGEAYVAFQSYARELSRRGIVLAVCSKNDEANALEPFEKHPDMVLRREDIGCFVANWTDKATNLRRIAAELNIGLDSLVFVDDNPVERALARRELPDVNTPEFSPEIADDPTGFIRALEDGGYFESVAFTADDRARSAQYQGNRAREALKAAHTDLDGYLRSLQMRLSWRRIDRLGLPRCVQLINKTNQFNLTTRRYSEQDVLGFLADPQNLALQFRLTDAFGDNGVIAIVMARPEGEADLRIDSWLMSCRVLGRQVEDATLAVLAAQAQTLGARRLIGDYLPTAKNAMVRDHYPRLGFAAIDQSETGATFALDLEGYAAKPTAIEILEG